jgi:hypothetical protein
MSLDPASIDEAFSPESVKVPEVAVKFKAPLVKVKPLEAVKSCETVNAPLFVVVIPLAPRVIAEVLAVPMFTWPLAVAPVPPWMTTFPPVLVPVPPVELPPWRVRVPPTAVVVPVSSPALRVKAAPVPVAEVLFPGWKTKAVGEAPAAVVMSGF